MRYDQQQLLKELHNNYTAHLSLNALINHPDLQTNFGPKFIYILKLMTDAQYLNTIAQIDQVNSSISQAEISSFIFLDAARHRNKHKEILRISFDSVVHHHRQDPTPPFGTTFEFWTRHPQQAHLVGEYLPLCPHHWKEHVELGLVGFFARERGDAPLLFQILEHFTITQKQAETFLTWMGPHDALEVINMSLNEHHLNTKRLQFFTHVLDLINKYAHIKNSKTPKYSPYASGTNQPLTQSELNLLHTLQHDITSQLQKIVLQKHMGELGEHNHKRKL